MRLQLIVLAALAGRAAADPSARSSLRVYGDDDHVTVVSPSVAAEETVGASTIDVDAGADVVTGASVDVITSASPRPVHERRVDGGVGVAHPVGAHWTVSAEARGSHENDYDGVRAGVGARADLAAHDTTLDLKVQLAGANIGEVGDPDFHASHRSQEAIAVVTQVIDPRTVIDVVADGTLGSGFEASPYRRVPVIDPAAPMPTFYREATPDRHRAIAIAGQIRRALGRDWAVRVEDRVYADDWDMASETALVEVRRPIGDRVLLAAIARGYLQRGASFYRARYVADPTPPTLRTRDRVLGPMGSAFASATCDVALGAGAAWHLALTTGLLATWTPDFPAQTGRRAIVITAALSLPLGEL